MFVEQSRNVPAGDQHAGFHVSLHREAGQIYGPIASSDRGRPMGVFVQRLKDEPLAKPPLRF
jgi:hypothetical protein